MKRRNRFSIKRLLSSPVTLVVMAVVFAVSARSAWTMFDRSRLSETKLDQAEAQYAKLGDSQAQLSEEVGELSSPGGVEADLREKYHAVAPGESVAVIVDNSVHGDPDRDLSAAAVETNSTAPAEGCWQRFWSFLGL